MPAAVAVAAHSALWRSRAVTSVGLVLLFALGVSVIWLPPRAPMVDLPQHAGQIALLRDLMLGRSPWAHEVRVNIFTPYLIGYGLALPLALVMPVAAAIKVALTAAYLAFALTCIGIRRELGAAPQLDAYFFISFFGFAYGWGMYTFLVAAPVGLGFVWLSIRYARRGGAGRGLWLAGLGLTLLFSHGLVFLWSCALGLGILLVNARSLKDAIARSWPFAIPLLMCAVLFVVTRQREEAGSISNQIAMGSLVARVHTILLGGLDDPAPRWMLLCCIALAAIPFAGRLKVDPGRTESLVIAAGVIGAIALMPSYAWSTGLLYPRFALFLSPAYAWLFSPATGARRHVTTTSDPLLGMVAIVIGALALFQHLADAMAFSRETKDFDAVIARAEPRSRALSLMLDPTSAARVNPEVYLHFPLWYQAEKQGFVDFNFAIFHPEVVRFARRPSPIDRYVSLGAGAGWFDWKLSHGSQYRYLFVRHTAPIPAGLFSGADCPPVQVAASGPWALYENRPCPARRSKAPAPRQHLPSGWTQIRS